MTTRQHTKLVLNEFIGTALGAIAGGLYLAKKQLDAGAAKGTGLRFRVGERIKTGIGERLANNGREALMKYSDKMQTDAHEKIATAYGMKSEKYALASIEQNIKAKAQEALSKSTTSTDIHIHDLDNVIAGRPTQHGVPTDVRLSATHRANTITAFELQDLTNPTAARFRKDMNTRIFAPQQAPRERLTTQIANSPQFLKNKAVPLEADRQQQKRDLAVKRANMPDPLARGIAPKERFKRILKRTFQKSVDDLRTIV
jgi:hypothetical protein